MPLTLNGRTQRRPRMFDRGLRNILGHQRNILGLKRNEVTGGWRELHKWAGHVASMRKKRNAYRVWGGRIA